VTTPELNAANGNVVPVSIDMSAMVRRSVASLYSHLVTRPMGQALRLGIESQLADLGEFCVSVLDFTQVVVLDYSCADEAVAKLILRYQREDRPAEVYFIARGVAEQHLEPIEAVLARHDLALVVELAEQRYSVLGTTTEIERTIWNGLQELGSTVPDKIGAACGLSADSAESVLSGLAARRLALRQRERYAALSSLLQLPDQNPTSDRAIDRTHPSRPMLA
jgi:hypothetical protein